MEVISLQSGSNGNSFYVKVADKQFLFDAGITGSVAEKRLASHGRDIRQVDALFISHAHRDHCKSMGVFHRKFGHSLFINERTLMQARRDHQLGTLNDVQFFQSGQSIDFGTVQVHTVPTPHDADGSVAFVVEHKKHRMGILTDMGHAFSGLREVLGLLDAVVIESNYDSEMLARSRYPEWLKRRVRGKGGHLSNDDSAELISNSASKRLQWACLCHLSEENNCPDVALEAHRRLLGNQVDLHVASRYDVGQVLKVKYSDDSRREWPFQKGPKEQQLSLF